MSKTLKIIAFVQLQLIVVALVIVFIKLNAIEQKLFNTNRFVHELLQNKRLNELNTVNENDIIIGDLNAPLSIFLYNKYDCSACYNFILKTYPYLKQEFIDKGKVNMVIRQLTHKSKKETLFITKCAHYAYENGFYEEFQNSLYAQYPSTDTLLVRSLILEIYDDNSALDSYLNNPDFESHILRQANKFRKQGIKFTPTMYIGDGKIVGNQSFNVIEQTILDELKAINVK